MEARGFIPYQPNDNHCRLDRIDTIGICGKKIDSVETYGDLGP